MKHIADEFAEKMPFLSEKIDSQSLITCINKDCIHNNYNACNCKHVTIRDAKCINFCSINEFVPEEMWVES